MKKALITLAAATFLYGNAFAGNATVTLESIPAAFQARTVALKTPSNALTGAVAAAIGVDTYIVVVNYTGTTIKVIFPTNELALTQRTAGRYERAHYTGLSYVELRNMQDTIFWAGNAQYHDIISVYVSNGKYVVYDTPDQN